MNGLSSSDRQVDIFQIVRRGKLDLYRQHIDEFNIDVLNEYGQSLLHEAVAYKQVDLAEDLLNKGINVNIQDRKGQTVLHFIGFHTTNTALAEAIINKGGRLDLKDLHGNIPLWYAVINSKGNYDLIRLLIKHGSDPLSKNKSGRTPVDMAMQMKDETLQSILFKKSL